MAQMHLSRTISAVLTTLTLMTTDYFCNTILVNSESFGTKIETTGLDGTSPDHTAYRHGDDDRHLQRNDPATLLAKRSTAPLIGAGRMNMFRVRPTRRRAGAVDSASANKANFEGKISRNSTATWHSQQTLKTAGYWLMSSPIRASSGARPHTMLSTLTRTDAGRRPVSVRRRRTDDARQLRQGTWSISQNDMGDKARRRPPLNSSELVSKENSQEELKPITDNSSQLGGWYGDPEVDAKPLVNKDNRDFYHKYFVGKRHRLPTVWLRGVRA